MDISKIEETGLVHNKKETDDVIRWDVENTGIVLTYFKKQDQYQLCCNIICTVRLDLLNTQSIVESIEDFKNYMMIY